MIWFSLKFRTWLASPALPIRQPILIWLYSEVFPGGRQRREFAYLFQLAHAAMQMDVQKTLYCFYTQ